MNQDKWIEIKKQLVNNFEVLDEYEEDLDPGLADVVEFEGPQGKMKVSFITRPKMLDKKTSYSNRAGSAVKVDYVFSEDEFVSHMEVYSWSDDQDDWRKIDAEALF